ncbi:diguanylate cyclase domain-containing protein [Zavarzinia sp. CC-PAN008]|uniref:diguanylate cyclase domain-containing protein n=1 Tax=Zavarzinia sp. CC-PAN008 TaxID=3243332 RepID=UPI003F748674
MVDPGAGVDAVVYRNILQYMEGGVVTIDLEGTVTTFNPGAERLCALSASEILGKPFAATFLEREGTDAFVQAVLDAIYERDSTHSCDVTYGLGGDVRHLSVTTSFLWDWDAVQRRPQRRGVIALFTDISDRKRAEHSLRNMNEELERRVLERTEEIRRVNEDLRAEVAERRRAQEALSHLAKHDSLTGLANRVLFEDRLRLALARSRRQSGSLALLYLDLDGFKGVNDSQGHAFGDFLLAEVARRLERCVREVDLVARLGGDEFAAILENVRTEGEIMAVVQRIMAALGDPFVNDEGRSGQVGVSVGIAPHPAAGDDMPALIRAADVAMYTAKRAGKGQYRFYSPHMAQDRVD